jgi:microsomal epoxide hydrolase
MLYWLGGINAANWLYESMVNGSGLAAAPGQRVETPTGVLLFPNDIAAPSPRSWAERVYNVTSWRTHDSGGHFPAFENGPLYVEELRSFFRESH